jgi:hypothetical protein
MRWLLVLLLCPTLAWANAKPCERVITMDTPTVLERIALQPLRGVTLRLPIELSPQAFYHISDASWLNYQEAPRQNLVAVAFNDLKRQSFEQDVDLVISDQGLSFVLTFGIVKPSERYCPLITLRLSPALQQQRLASAQAKKKQLEKHQQQDQRLAQRAQAQAYQLMATLLTQKPRKRSIRAKAILQQNGKIIARVDSIETYPTLSVLHGRLINDSDQEIEVEALRLSSPHTQHYAVERQKVAAGASTRYHLVTDAPDVQDGATLNLRVSQQDISIKW